MFLVANNLKMDRVTRICAQHLIKHLSVDNCIEIRSLPGIARNKEFIQQVDVFIANEVRLTENNRLSSPNPPFYVSVLENKQNQQRPKSLLRSNRSSQPIPRGDVPGERELPLQTRPGMDQETSERRQPQHVLSIRKDIHALPSYRQFPSGLLQSPVGRHKRHGNRARLQEAFVKRQTEQHQAQAEGVGSALEAEGADIQQGDRGGVGERT